MKLLTLKVEDSIYSDLINFIGKYKTTIEIIDSFDDVFTKEDEAYFDLALKELAEGKAISLEQLKLEIANV